MLRSVKARETRSRGQARGLTFETVRQLALALSGVEEGLSYGTPAFRVRGKLLARLREDGESLVVKIDLDERELLMGADPETFYITEHYRNYPAMLVRLARVDTEALRALLEEAWRCAAPKRLLVAYSDGLAKSMTAPAKKRR
jgi:hypothetical protein